MPCLWVVGVLTEAQLKALEVNIRAESMLYGNVLIAFHPDGQPEVISFAEHDIVVTCLPSCLNESHRIKSERSLHAPA